MFAIETLMTNQPATSTAPMVWSRHLPLSSLNSVEPTWLMQPSFNSQGTGTVIRKWLLYHELDVAKFLFTATNYDLFSDRQ